MNLENPATACHHHRYMGHDDEKTEQKMLDDHQTMSASPNHRREKIVLRPSEEFGTATPKKLNKKHVKNFYYESDDEDSCDLKVSGHLYRTLRVRQKSARDLIAAQRASLRNLITEQKDQILNISSHSLKKKSSHHSRRHPGSRSTSLRGLIVESLHERDLCRERLATTPQSQFDDSTSVLGASSFHLDNHSLENSQDWEGVAMGIEFAHEDDVNEEKLKQSLGKQQHQHREQDHQHHQEEQSSWLNHQHTQQQEVMVPVAENMMEVEPGVWLPLRGSKETWEAIKMGNITVAICCGCRHDLHCVEDAKFVVCRDCWVVSPVDTSGDLLESPNQQAHGIALGVKAQDIIDWLGTQ